MKKLFLSFVVAIVLGGCASTTIYNPEETTTGIRNQWSISHEEMREVSIEAVKDIFASPRFKSYVENFRAKHGRNPMLMLDPVINETEDTNLNSALMTDTICQQLLNYGIVEVTMAAGYEMTDSLAGIRAISNDPNFNQTTVATGTMTAPNLVLRPKIYSHITRSGRWENVERWFAMDLCEAERGSTIWKYTKPLGFIKEKAVIGW